MTQSLIDKSYYIGYTSRLVEARLKDHNAGKGWYTKGHKPYKIIKAEEVKTLKEAKEIEKRYKETKKAKRIVEMKGSPEARLRD